jgi:hypothetical protein
MGHRARRQAPIKRAKCANSRKLQAQTRRQGGRSSVDTRCWRIPQMARPASTLRLRDCVISLARHGQPNDT